MIAVATQTRDERAAPLRLAVTPAVELMVLGIAAAIAIGSYFVLTSDKLMGRLIPPPLIALLLVANIVPGVVILMLIGRRIARRRAAQSPIGGRGQLHVRLVAIFSILSAVPMLLVTVVASLLFQYGVQFWYSGQARTVFENAIVLTRQSYDLILDRWENEAVTMAGDMAQEVARSPVARRSLGSYVESQAFADFYVRQVYTRSLSESALFAVAPDHGVQTLAIVNPYAVDFQRLITPKSIVKLRRGQRSVVVVTGSRSSRGCPAPTSSSSMPRR